MQRQDRLLLPTRSSLAVVLHLGFFLSSFLLGKSRLRLFQGLISESLIVTLFSHIPRSPDNPTGGSGASAHTMCLVAVHTGAPARP